MDNLNVLLFLLLFIFIDADQNVYTWSKNLKLSQGYSKEVHN